MEEEYMEASEAAKEVVWLRKILLDLEIVSSTSQLITLYFNNNGVLTNVKEPWSYQCGWQFERKYHLVREINQWREVVVCKIALAENFANPFTESLLVRTWGAYWEYECFTYLLDMFFSLRKFVCTYDIFKIKR